MTTKNLEFHPGISIGSANISAPTGDIETLGNLTVTGATFGGNIYQNGNRVLDATTKLQLNQLDSGNATTGQTLIWSSVSASWVPGTPGAISTAALPTQTDNAGKFLTTDGNTASWTSVVTVTAIQSTDLLVDSTTSSGTILINLSDSGVVAGAYSSVIVDGKGRVVAGSNPTTLAGYGITDAFSGSYADLTNKPVLANVAFSGNYTDLINTPTLFSGSYADLTNKPVLANVAFSGNYTDLTNKPTNLATESYVTTSISNLINSAPDALNTLNELAQAINNDANLTTTIFSQLATKANISSLANVATSGSYIDLNNKPVLANVATTGSFNDLTNKPTTISGYGITNAATLTGTETLSNKTLTAPTVNAPKVKGEQAATASLGTLATGTTIIDLSAAEIFAATITASATVAFGFSNTPPTGYAQMVMLQITNGGSGTITWPAGTKFSGGTAPALSTTGVDLLGIFYNSFLSSYVIFLLGKDIK